MPDLYPPSVLAAAEAAIRDEMRAGSESKWPPILARAVLDAAVPLLERSARRRMAREILLLDALDAKLTRPVGPYGDMKTSLRRIARGEPLPGVRDLRGGEVPEVPGEH